MYAVCCYFPQMGVIVQVSYGTFSRHNAAQKMLLEVSAKVRVTLNIPIENFFIHDVLAHTNRKGNT